MILDGAQGGFRGFPGLRSETGGTRTLGLLLEWQT
jgi:hypothetical protein